MEPFLCPLPAVLTDSTLKTEAMEAGFIILISQMRKPRPTMWKRPGPHHTAGKEKIQHCILDLGHNWGVVCGCYLDI